MEILLTYPLDPPNLSPRGPPLFENLFYPLVTPSTPFLPLKKFNILGGQVWAPLLKKNPARSMSMTIFWLLGCCHQTGWGQGAIFCQIKVKSILDPLVFRGKKGQNKDETPHFSKERLNPWMVLNAWRTFVLKLFYLQHHIIISIFFISCSHEHRIISVTHSFVPIGIICSQMT